MSLITERTDLDTINENLAFTYTQTVSQNIKLSDIKTILNSINANSNASKFDKFSCGFGRPNNTIAYGANNVINALIGSTALPFFNFTGHEGELFIMQSITFIDESNSTLAPMRICFYDVPSMASQNWGDNQASTISFADIQQHQLCLGSVSSAVLQKVSSLCYADQYQNRQFIIPSSGKVYMGLFSNSAFTPIALENFQFDLIGQFTTPL